ncbi:MAG: response regulator transcription factor [Chloroflexi bacterium]|nr:response regulator transcription factor [Chloroflexota bacterium]
MSPSFTRSPQRGRDVLYSRRPRAAKIWARSCTRGPRSPSPTAHPHITRSCDRASRPPAPILQGAREDATAGSSRVGQRTGGIMIGTTASKAAQAENFMAVLSPQEREVVDQMAEGWTNAKIAERLFLSPKTVENRVSAMYEKLPRADGVDRRVQVVLFVLLATAPAAAQRPSP